MNDFTWLMKWFWMQCDGEWEDGYGITLNSTDSQGWFLSISLNETELEEIDFCRRDEKNNEGDFLQCYVDNIKFKGYCSFNKILELLEIFRNFAEPHIQIEKTSDFLPMGNENDFFWLLQWYKNCNLERLESRDRIQIGTLSNPGWALDINLLGTTLENKSFAKVKIDNSETDWIFCSIKKNLFTGNSGPFGFYQIIEKFKGINQSKQNNIFEQR